jgi:hypothetical protein
MTKQIKVKTKSCWICSKKLWGKNFRLIYDQGYARKVHASCIERKHYDEEIPLEALNT